MKENNEEENTINHAISVQSLIEKKDVGNYFWISSTNTDSSKDYVKASLLSISSKHIYGVVFNTCKGEIRVLSDSSSKDLYRSNSDFGFDFGWINQEDFLAAIKAERILDRIISKNKLPFKRTTAEQDDRIHMELDTPLRAIAIELSQMLEEKNKSYGDSYGRCHKILNELWPNGVEFKDYHKLLAVTRVIDKLFRIANDEKAFSEDPWRDIAGYAMLMINKAGKND